MAWCDDPKDPQYNYCQQTYAVLSKAVDAKGRPFEIHKILVPEPALYMNKDESVGISKVVMARKVGPKGRDLPPATSTSTKAKISS
jgi:agmatine deiminase